MFVLDELQACLAEPWTLTVSYAESRWEASVVGESPVTDTWWETGDSASDALRRLCSFLVTGMSPRLCERNLPVDDPQVLAVRGVWRTMVADRARLDALHERMRREHTAELQAAEARKVERARWAAAGVVSTTRECDACQHSTVVPMVVDRWVCGECGTSNGADVATWPVQPSEPAG